MKGEAVAWLVTGGRMFVDRAFISRKAAENSVAERKDGATVVPLAPQAEKDAEPDFTTLMKLYDLAHEVSSISFSINARAILAAIKDKP